MKRLVLIIVMAVSTALPLLGEARDGGFAPILQAQGQPGKKGQGEFRRGGQDFRREKEARPRDERPSGRMTEEERRELHRDLDRANREIYRRNPQR